MSILSIIGFFIMWPSIAILQRRPESWEIVSQNISARAMNCLEQQVHATLFIRTYRGVQLTSEGEELYNYVSAAMAQIFAAEEALSENDGLLHGKIVIGTSGSGAEYFFGGSIKKFPSELPGNPFKNL